MKFFEKTLTTDKIYSGRIINVELQTVELSNGKTAARELVRHHGGVAVIPLTSDNKIILVKQFRKPYEEELLEIPAGKLEMGELPEVCAVRELKEETGYEADKITYLSVMYPSPGYTDEKIYIYKAEGLKDGEMKLDEDEFLTAETYPLEEALKMVKAGHIKDAKSVIAILLLASEINS